jgi:hypothetical protein
MGLISERVPPEIGGTVFAGHNLSISFKILFFNHLIVFDGLPPRLLS